MSIELTLKVWQRSLPASPKIVLLALADQASQDGVCSPRLRDLAEKVGMSPHSVRAQLEQLESMGAVICERHAFRASTFRVLG
ncbi:helix-turn-helix domain-containing protein [Herbaspirillum seropedicae]|uniref:helix-turn-helix domain-containing protein n=1 Tax=Herbaspirillum seropedicae TaxID=964 RepID=UPI0028608027|nr:helix-turn-helix domain-containing protein [Herbaspirillum seropedicae]MDR6394647.1 putative ArsR family transcriptional regulator [Herbaspirillum seropedicae]